MLTKKLDIVYPVKESAFNEELRYSLRSLINLPHKDVYIYGSKPDWVTNVKFVKETQTGTKWQNTSQMLCDIVNNPDISDNFILFNDDFFVLKPIEKLGHYYEGNLEERVARTYISRFMWEIPHYSRYGLLLKETMEWLQNQGYSTINYEVHVPMLYNKKKLKKCLEMFPDGGWAARRSLYGNVMKIGGQGITDVKIYSRINFSRTGIDEFVSTTDDSFANGLVGNFIRKRFKEKSVYEKS